MFTIDQKSGLYFPTIYLLSQMEYMVDQKIFLKPGVEQYIFKGADLMWPGIEAVSKENF